MGRITEAMFALYSSKQEWKKYGKEGYFYNLPFKPTEKKRKINKYLLRKKKGVNFGEI